MRSLAGALRESAHIGEPLPVVWKELMNEGVEFRRGQLVVIASAPGVGKSLVANILAVRSGVPALYLSCDTDAYTVATRVGAHLTGKTIDQMDADLEPAKALLKNLTDIRWAFDSNLSMDEIVEQVKAFDLMYGEPPHLIVVDNLSSLYSEDENPYLGYRLYMEQLNILARESGACVVVLHHLTGYYESGDVPPPLGALEGKVGKLPSLVLTLFNGKFNDLGLCIVKNRFGPAKADGYLRLYLTTDKARVRIGG